MRTRFIALTVATAAPCIVLPCLADVAFYDVDADPAAWEQALADEDVAFFGAIDFGDLPDFGIAHADPIESPLCDEGNELIPPGMIPSGVCFDGFNPDRGDDAHLDFVGPSSGLVTSNGIVSGFFDDAFEIVFEEPVRAIELLTVSLLGSGSVGLVAFNENGAVIGGLELAGAAEPDGRRSGILARSGETIARLLIHDNVGGGAEGLMEFAAWRNAGSTSLTAFEIAIGQLQRGELPDLIASDDVYVDATSGFGARLSEVHLLHVHFCARTETQSPSSISLRLESAIDQQSGSLQVQLRNWNTRLLEHVALRSVGSDETVVLIDGIDAANYVSGDGEIEIAARYVVHVPFLAFQFEAHVDQFHVEVR